MITLYQGGQYKLYTYRKYSDVRLVFAPEQQMAFFGGDPTISISRAMTWIAPSCGFTRNGKPAVTPGHLKWSWRRRPATGEPVFIAGNPGSTQRLLTAEQLETIRDGVAPRHAASAFRAARPADRFGEESPEHARIANEDLFGVENSFKALHGQEEALVDPAWSPPSANSMPICAPR